MKHIKRRILYLLFFGLLWAGLTPNVLASPVDVGCKGFPLSGERERGFHLGNTRVVFTGHGYGKPEVNQLTSYDPYGLVTSQTSYYATGASRNKLLYNGKELQDETLAGTQIDWYDYGARFYDPELGRWNGVDPLAEKYYSWSPYNYVADNPMKFIDPNGMNLDNYGVDDFGKVKKLEDTKDNYDVLYKVKKDDKGNLVKQDTDNKTGVSESDGVKVNDRSVLPELTKTKTTGDGYGVTYAKSDKQSDMANLFLFVANNTNVEWSLSGYNDTGKNSFTLSTFNVDYQAPSSWEANDKIQNQQIDIHSHTLINHEFGASGKGGDMGFYDLNARIMQQLGKNIFFHGVYEKENKTLYQYTNRNPALKSWYIGNNASKLLTR